MATAYVLGCSGAAVSNGKAELLFHIDVVDTVTAFEGAQECTVLLNGDETAEQFKVAMVAQILPQLETYFPEYNFTASDLVLVSVVKGA